MIHCMIKLHIIHCMIKPIFQLVYTHVALLVFMVLLKF